MKKSAKSKKPTKAKKTSAKNVRVKKRAQTNDAAFYAVTKRLGLRLLESGDRELYCELFTDPKTMEFVMPPLSRERAENSFRKALEITQRKPFQQHISVIVERASGKPIGITSLKLIDAEKRHAEGGVLLKPGAHAQRFGTECTIAGISQAFTWHSIEELHTWIPVGHTVNERVVSKAGFARFSELSANEGLPTRGVWRIARETWASNSK